MKKLIYLSWLIGLSRIELQRGPEDTFPFGERSHAGNAEILVRSATEATEVVIFARPHQMPVKEVTRAIESGLHISLLEMAALNNSVHSLENIRRFKFERTGNKKTPDCGFGFFGEVEQVTALVNLSLIHI